MILFFNKLCRHWPIFPIRRQISIFGTAELNFRVRNGNGWTLCVRNTDCLPFCGKASFFKRLERKTKIKFCVSIDLFSRSVARQVSSALQSLTSVFGMGTGGPSALETLTRLRFSVIFCFDSKHSIKAKLIIGCRHCLFGAPSGIRTRDPLIKSQLLYQLS